MCEIRALRNAAYRSSRFSVPHQLLEHAIVKAGVVEDGDLQVEYLRLPYQQGTITGWNDLIQQVMGRMQMVQVRIARMRRIDAQVGERDQETIISGESRCVEQQAEGQAQSDHDRGASPPQPMGRPRGTDARNQGDQREDGHQEPIDAMCQEPPGKQHVTAECRQVDYVPPVGFGEQAQ